jgi:glycosyltransferase involved in cell wall biosynthesis
MTMQQPRVSIWLPVYNGQKYLDAALASILAQDYGDFELIIGDNASTDGTQAICQAWAARDGRVRCYRHEHNLGAAPNYNFVLAQARGEYFRWAAYDDLIAPDFLSKCVAVLDQQADVVLCYPRVKLIDERGDYVDAYDPRPDLRTLKPHERFRATLRTPSLCTQVFGLMRAEVLRATGQHGSFPSADEILLAELALHGRFYEIRERLFFNRVHPEQSTKGVLSNQRERTAWFNTALQGRIVLPKWLYLRGGLAAVRRAPLSGGERARCYLHLVRWAMVPANFRALGKDVVLAAREVARRTIRHVRPRAGVEAGEAMSVR